MKTRNQRARTGLATALVALLAVAVASCIDSDEPFIIEPAGGTLFDRYVSLGNSITAGYISDGINIEFQRQAYPVLLAGKANARFGIPALTMPGCPPPLAGPLTTTRIDTTSCSLRTLNPPDLVQNLAVPGADVADASNPEGTGTILNTLILGGRTQLDAMRQAEPTLVSVWLGNGDALNAALSGVSQLLTPLAAFQSDYDEIVAAIDETDAQDAILIGAANAAVVAPVLQPGAYFWALAQDPPPGLPTINVAANCAPFDGTGSPNPTGFRLISFVGVAAAIGAGLDPITIDCVNGVSLPGSDADFLLDETELAAIQTRVAEYNAYIAQVAGDNGWIYVDPASFIEPALSDPDKIRKCQGLATATTATEFALAVQNTCPVDLDPATDITFFGSFFGHDGFHPSTEAHTVIADSLANRLNAAHGLSLPVN